MAAGEGLITIIEKNNFKIGLEIGVSLGSTTELLLKTSPNLKLYGIDPYKYYVDWNGNQIIDGDTYMETMLKAVSPYKSRFTHLKMTSDEAADLFENESLDFIFIDGLHSFEQVKKDCENYYPKLKNGGLFSGHDYFGILEVRNAIDSFKNTINKDLQFTNNDVWFFYK
jgi:predicted O-methyltransferase YrrM